MAKQVYIYSTMSSDNKINIFVDGAEKGKKVIANSVVINGKANISDKRTLITPKGMLTTLDEEVYNKIKEDTHFKKWVNAGYITVEVKKADEVSDVSKNMTKKDKSAPKTKTDFNNSVQVVEG